jgi:serine/threonine protein kinase
MKYGNRFLTTKKIGSGSFGIVYKGIDLKTNREVAIKIEPRSAGFGYLFAESKVLKKLKR